MSPFGEIVLCQFGEGGIMDHDSRHQLEVITGCMFSGKTEELIRRLERVTIANRAVLVVKPSIDDRYGVSEVKTHYGRGWDAILLQPGQETIDKLQFAVGYNNMKPTNIEEVSSPEFITKIMESGKSLLDKVDVIAFDEGQFFSDKLPDLCEDLVARGKRVIVAGLDLTFAAEPFMPMPDLMALADCVDKLHAVCVKCGGEATRSQRLIDGEPAPVDSPTIQIGGVGSYEARCRYCFLKL